MHKCTEKQNNYWMNDKRAEHVLIAFGNFPVFLAQWEASIDINSDVNRRPSIENNFYFRF